MKALIPSLVLALLFVFPFTAHAQWTKNESLSGGSIVTDIIEFNQSLFVSYNETGIFRSLDKGETWLPTPVPSQPNFTSMVVAGNRLVAISSGKTYFTTNGVDWTSGPGPEAFINEADSEGDVIFAATHLGVYKSVDRGASWQRASDAQVQVNIKSISVSGTNVWASADLPAAGTLFMSGDGGSTWTKVTKGTTTALDVATTPTEVYINLPNDGIYRSVNQGTDWQKVRDLNNIYGKMFVSAAGIFFVSPYNLYYSKNSGSTWQQKSKSYPYFNFSSLYANNENIYLGLWGGGMLTTPHTDASVDWRFINKGIACHYIHDFVFEGNKLYSGLENSFLKISEDLGETWSQKSGVFGLFGFSVRSLMVKNGVIYTGSGGGGVYKSTDGGTTWTEKSEGLVSKNVLSIVSTAISIFAACDDGVYKSTNGADSWTKKTPAGITMRKLYSNGTALYAASYNGLFESKDDGETWSKINDGLPGPSVTDVITMGPVLIVATQFNGLYKTTNSGTTWTKLNDLYVLKFSSHNQYLFMSVLSGNLLISGDTAKTTEDISAALPFGYLSYGGVIGDNIFAAKANKGYWTRKATSVMKPYVTLTAPRAQNKLSLTESITLNSDQKLFSTAGVAISATNIGTNININDKAGNPIAFSAQVASDERSFNLTITNPKLEETYTVLVRPLLNDSGLSSAQVVANFTVVNPIPVVADITLNMEVDRTPVSFRYEIFEAAYQDDQSMTGIIVTTLPANGQLKIDETPVTVSQVIAPNKISNLTYTANPLFSGNDSWNWNASDGISYAASDATVTIVVSTVTDISEVSDPEILIYPNPASSTVQVELVAIDAVDLKVYDIMGRQVSDILLPSSQPTGRAIYVVNTQSYQPGLYLVRVDFGERHVVSKFTKR